MAKPHSPLELPAYAGPSIAGTIGAI